MKKQLLKLSLAICVALLAGCAKSTLVATIGAIEYKDPPWLFILIGLPLGLALAAAALAGLGSAIN